jgi:hypothetical protein
MVMVLLINSGRLDGTKMKKAWLPLTAPKTNPVEVQVGVPEGGSRETWRLPEAWGVRDQLPEDENVASLTPPKISLPLTIMPTTVRLVKDAVKLALRISVKEISCDPPYRASAFKFVETFKEPE